MSAILQPHQRGSLLTAEFGGRCSEATVRDAILRHVPDRQLSVLGETLYLDSRLALVDNMLLYFDKMSMAASLEVRVPFMDHDVVEFCAALPDSRRVWRTRRKEILKRASRGLVDDWVIDKKKRGFFHSALSAWLRLHRDRLFTEVLLDARTAARGQFRPEALKELIGDAGEGGKKSDQLLFCALLLEQWQRFYVDADGRGRRLAERVDSNVLA
jgi:asparagine synthase (glutamine-hydrolysing)